MKYIKILISIKKLESGKNIIIKKIRDINESENSE